MRLIFGAIFAVAALIAATASAQSDSRKKLQELDQQKLLRVQAQIQAVEAQVQPLLLEQNGIVRRLCLALGVPEAKIQAECKVDVGALPDAPFGEVRWEKPKGASK